MTLFCYSGILIVNFELISHHSLVFLLLNLNFFFFFLPDFGSQFTIITRETCGSLKTKLVFSKWNRS